MRGVTPLPRTATRAFAGGGLLLLASAGILWALDTPTVAYVATALLHVGIGIVWTVLLGYVLVRERAAIAPGLWWPAVLAWTASTVAAALLIARGALTSQRPVVLAHVLAAIAGVALLLLATRRWTAGRSGRVAWTAAAVLLVIGGASAAGYREWDRKRSAAAEAIVNPALPPVSMDGEGAGPQGPFFPSSAAPTSGGIIHSNFFLTTEACGRCHPDIFKQWNSSAHHFSSFNNQWYRKSIEYMQDVVGTQPVQVVRGLPRPRASSSTAASTARSRSRSTRRKRRPASAAPPATRSCTSGARWARATSPIEYPPLHDLAASENPVLAKVHDYC